MRAAGYCAAEVLHQAAPGYFDRSPEALRVRPDHHEQAQAESPVFVPHGARHVAVDPRGAVRVKCRGWCQLLGIYFIGFRGCTVFRQNLRERSRRRVGGQAVREETHERVVDVGHEIA